MENYYDEQLEPSYTMRIDSEDYYETLQEKDDEIKEVTYQKEIIEEKLDNLVNKIFKIGNRNGSVINNEFAEIIEYIHKEKLDEKILSKKY